MDLSLGPNSDASWLGHLERLAPRLCAGVSCLDNVDGMTALWGKSVSSPTECAAQSRPSINVSFLPSVAGPGLALQVGGGEKAATARPAWGPADPTL